MTDELLQLPLEAIAPSGLNPRKLFDQAELDELAASIREHGLLEPLVVRRRERDPDDGDSASEPAPRLIYVLIAGERRYRAAGFAGLTHVPAIVRETTNDVAALMLVENLQRADLTPLEEAQAFQAWMKSIGDGGEKPSIKALAKQIGKSDDYVRERLRLLKLPEAAHRMLTAGELPLKTALLLTRCDPKMLKDDLARVVDGAWTAGDLLRRAQNSLIDLHSAPFDLAKSSPSCVGCPDRLMRGGQVPLPGLGPKEKDLGFCGNAQCFADKCATYARDKLGATVVERDEVKGRGIFRLWDAKWKKSCPGCESKTAVIEPTNRDEPIQRFCLDQAAHFGRDEASLPPEDRKADRKKALAREKAARDEHGRRLAAVYTWVRERLATPDGTHFVLMAMTRGCWRKADGDAVGRLSGIQMSRKATDNYESISELAEKLAKGPEKLNLLAAIAVVKRFEGDWQPYRDYEELVQFLRTNGITVPKGEDKAKVARKGKA